MTDKTLNQERVEALLGRSLSEGEAKNFDLQLKIAAITVSDLICDDVQKMEAIPEDLQLAVARFYDARLKYQAMEAGVKSKEVEDFRITFKDDYDPYQEVIKLCQATLMKYSKCETGIIHGRTIYDCHGV